ncbi:filamentous hemagglutinin N-terminal domain-containing protein, partial [Pseudomonas panipatensis]
MDIRRPLFQAIASALAGILFLNPIVATAAQLAVDAAAGGNTQIGAAGNGVPIVNIATPNGAGLSHNKFSDFNVGPQGLILNNATGKTQATQLGGIVVGNPNLKGQAAQKILNEVTGGSPSHLQGYTEVAGQGAHVIVANPNGITCSGCGFINTPRATLATGKPILNGERLQGYDVDGGAISIDGAGLNASNIDRFELITRSAKLNADLYARQLTVVAGRNQVDAETLAATPKPDNGSAKPQLAIDSAALGGMYANTIRLVGTEAGVGVRLAGNMAASAGDIRIDANGKLELAQTAASGNLALKGQDVALNGPVYAGGSANIQAGGTLSNAQSLAASSTIALQANQLNNSGVIEAGVNPDNSRNGQGDVTLTAQGVRNTGTVLASRTLQANVGGTLDNQGGTLKGSSTALSTGSLDNRQGRLLAGGQLSLNAARLDNRNGKAVATALQVTGGTLDNRLGLFSADQALSLDLASIDNSGQGTLISNGTLQAKVSQRLDNHANGLLSAKGALGVQAGALDNRGGALLSDAGLSLSGGSLNNSAQGVVSGKGAVQVDLDQLDNSQGGTLNSDAGLQLHANQVNNASQGSIAAKGNLQADIGNLQQQGGELLSQGALDLTVGQLDNGNGGLLAANQGVTLHGGDLLNQGGEISSKAGVAVRADSLDNSGGKLIGDAGLTLDVQRLVNRQGNLSGRAGLSLQGGSLDNSQGGLLSSQGDIRLQLSGALDNHGQGAVLSERSLTLNAASLNNGGGVLSTAGPLFARLAGALNNQGGKLLSDAGIDLASGDLDNSHGGTLSAAGDIQLQTARLDNSQAGRIVTDAGIHLASAQLDNSQGGSLSARGAIDGRVSGLDQHGGGQLVSQTGIDLDLQGGALNNASAGLITTPGALLLRNAGSIDNRGGEISSDRAFTLATGNLLNQGGKILSADRLQVQGAAVNNSQGGVLSGSQGLSVNAASLDNSQGGTLASRGDLLVRSQGALDNSGNGALVAGGQLDVGSASLNNQGGLLSASGNLLLATGNADNRNGKVIAQGRLDATTANLDNRDGVLSGQQGLTLHAGDLRNGSNAVGQPGGLITSQGALDLHAGQFEAIGGGEVSAKGDLQLAVAKLIQQQAQLIGEGKVRIDLGSAGQPGDFDNRGGLLSAGGALQVNGLGNLDNRGGEISSAQGFALNASGTLDNGDQGRLISAGQLTLGAAALRNANQGLLSGWQGLSVHAASLDNSAGGTLSSRNGSLDLSLGGALDNHDQGALVSQGKVTLAAASLNNANGILSTQGDLGLTLAGDLDNRNGGLLSAQGALTGSGAALDNRGGQISANGVQFDATLLDNSGGSLSSRGGLRLGLLGALLNVGANSKLASAGPLNLSAGSVDNRGGQLVSQGLLSVLAGRFDNGAGGTVASQDGLGLTLSGALLNGQDGLIYSKAGTLDIGAASLDNTAGTLQGQLDTTLRIQDAAANQGGRITSQAGNLDLQAASLDNGSGGILSSAAGWLKLVSGWFGNNAGITQAQALDVQATGGIDNRNGHLSAVSGDNQIVTSTLDNGNGGLYAGGLLSLRGNQLLNQSGKVGAGSLDFGLAGALNNQSGLIEASNTLTLGAASIDNVAGAIRALGQAPASLARSASPSLMQITTSGLLNNNLGRIEGATSDFSLQSGSLQNGGGSVLHVGSGTFGLDLAQAGLAGGSFTSNGSLSYQAASWTNNAVIQARDLTLDISQLSQGSGGQLLAAQTFSGSGGDWSNDGLIASDGRLDLHLTGRYSGTGRLSSLGNLSLGAGYIGLGANASLAGGGTTSVSSSGSLDNSGRLTSAADLKLSAASLNNDGTLGSAGALRIEAANLLNQNGLIFSGGDMALRVGSFVNRYADVYSLGALDLAADDQGNWASSVLNSSGSLESVGDFSLRAASISNTREGLSVNDLGVYTARITELACDHRYVGDCEGSNRNGIFEVVQREKLTVSGGAAAQMTSGGNMRLLGGQLTNQSSAIAAGGALSISVDSLSNQGVVPGETQSTRVYVTARHTLGVHQDAANDFTRQYWFESSDYDPNNLSGLQPTLSHYLSTTESEISSLAKSETLSAGDQSYAAVIQAAGNADIRVGGNLDNTVVRPGYTYINPGRNTNTAVGASPVSTVVPINAQLPPSLAQQQINPITLPGFSLPTGSNGLFRLSGQSGSGGSASSVQGPQTLSFAGQSIGAAQRQQALDVGNRQTDGVSAPVASAAVSGPSSGALNVARVQGLPSSAVPDNSHKYLIETNPALTSLKSFLSSDYLLGQLGYDPDRAQKRLGDGLYEQRLLQQAVVARTGQRFIDGMASDEALFKYLMDNAIA